MTSSVLEGHFQSQTFSNEKGILHVLVRRFRPMKNTSQIRPDGESSKVVCTDDCALLLLELWQKYVAYFGLSGP